MISSLLPLIFSQLMRSAFFAMDLNGGAPLGGGKRGIDRVEVANFHYGPLTFVGKD